MRLILEQLLEVGPLPKDLSGAWPEDMAEEVKAMKEEDEGAAIESSVLGESRAVNPRRRVEAGLGVASGVVSSLSTTQIARLCNYIKEWNTHASFSYVAQQAFSLLMDSIPHERLRAIPEYVDTLKATMPYSERHFEVKLL